MIHANATPFSISSVSFSLLVLTSSALTRRSSSSARLTSARSGWLGSVMRRFPVGCWIEASVSTTLATATAISSAMEVLAFSRVNWRRVMMLEKRAWALVKSLRDSSSSARAKVRRKLEGETDWTSQRKKSKVEKAERRTSTGSPQRRNEGSQQPRRACRDLDCTWRRCTWRKREGRLISEALTFVLSRKKLPDLREESALSSDRLPQHVRHTRLRLLVRVQLERV